MKNLGSLVLLLVAPLLVAPALGTPASATTASTSPALTSPALTSPDARRTTSQVQHVSWNTYRDFKAGHRNGLKLGRGEVTINTRPKQRTIRGRHYDAGIWTSPWTTPGFAATSLIPSWEARTPGRSLVRIQVRARAADGTTGSWDTIADWSQSNRALTRTTYSGQPDDLGRVNVDTWQAATSVTSWQVRVLLLRPRGTTQPVALERVGAVASALAAPPTQVSTPGPGAGVELPVPTYSQMVHQGHYPQWGGGGQAWCSPTSLAMVLAFYGIAPTPTGFPADHPDAVVDHTASKVYDHGYRGTGNWAFNTAHAATLVAGDSYVTRMRDLREAEDHVVAGRPLIASIAFRRGQLTGAPISASNGHLLVIIGFTAKGDVIVNDPAGATNAVVRRVYDRAQFERIWLTASGGTAYVIHRD